MFIRQMLSFEVDEPASLEDGETGRFIVFGVQSTRGQKRRTFDEDEAYIFFP